jgi:hypothetical protein
MFGAGHPRPPLETTAMAMTNTLILEYVGRGLCVFHATDENLKTLTERVVALKVKGNDFANAATRLMDGSADLAKVDRADLDMTILMALNQIGGADLDDPHVKEILAGKKLIASLVSDDDGNFKHFHFLAGDDPAMFVNDDPDEIAKPRLN